MPPQSLPTSLSVDISALSRLFGETTNSYKYLFFVSLLRKAVASKSTKVCLQKLADDMLVIAWYPHVFFKLSFGVQDQTAMVLDKLNFSFGGKKVGSLSVENSLRSAFANQQGNIGSKGLLRYVPYRLLTVFFEAELRGQADQRKNGLIDQLAKNLFDTRKPFYRFCMSGEQTYLELHPEWIRYFSENYAVVCGWFYWEWQKYLQAKNPNVPAIQNKLFPPDCRMSLSTQKKYWREILSMREFKCIFSGETLHNNNYVLDHFLPWSFVCHDQLWNLIPVKASANSAKKHHIPDESYLKKFIEMQRDGLELSKEIFPEKQWRKTIEPFIGDMQLEYPELLNLEKLTYAYYRVVPPLMALATNSGFQANWRYSQKDD